jgi:ankyrin repeat protein
MPDTESKDEYSWIPLSWAAEEGHEAIMKLLLDPGVEAYLY